MNSGDDIYLRCQRTDLCDSTAVGTFVILQDHLADCFLLILVNSLSQYRKPFFLISEGLFQTGCDISDIFFSYLLNIGKYGLFHFCRRYDFLNGCKQFFRNGTAGILVLGLS